MIASTETCFWRLDIGQTKVGNLQNLNQVTQRAVTPDLRPTLLMFLEEAKSSPARVSDRDSEGVASLTRVRVDKNRLIERAEK